MKFTQKMVTLFSLILLILAAPAIAQQEGTGTVQQEESESEKTIDYFLDYSTFQAAGDSLILEVYLMIPRKQLEFRESDSLDQYLARGYVQIGLAKRDSIRLLDRWPFTDYADSLNQITDTQSIPDMAVFKTAPGDYELIAQVIDLHANVRGTKREMITLRQFDSDRLTISDIELASLVQPTENTSIFTKYNRDIVPNASKTFSISTPVLYSYAEIYNMNYPSEVDSYEVQYSILDLNNALVKSPQQSTYKKSSSYGADIGGLNVIGLSSGIYFYRIRVTDKATGEVATRSKKFYVYKQGEKIDASGLGQIAQEYEGMTEEELDETYDSMVPILSDKERKAYGSASDEGKRNLLAEFWGKRDPSPQTQINEQRVAYQQRLEYVKQQFGNANTPGYKSDRGRVYLVYGPPDEIERNPVSIDVKPYETWIYHSLQGGAQFIFVDKSGFGIYELVHSTARNELYDPNWQRYIEATPGAGSYQNY